MKISTKGIYALYLFIDLAQHRNNGFISLKDVSQRQGISRKYLEQIIPVFNKPDILKATRGPQGGYMLARSPEKYTVGEILRLTEGSLSPVDCADPGPAACEKSMYCPILPVWKGLANVINEYLDGITIQDLLDRQQELYTNTYII